MIKTILVCEECGRQRTQGRYFSLTYRETATQLGRMEDLCSEGCVIRRLSKILAISDNCMVARNEVALPATDRQESAPMPILVSGSG